MNRKPLLFVAVVLAVSMILSACSSSKPKPLLIVAMTTPPPGALEINFSTPLAATVTNDASGGGVTWTLACDATDCGTLTAGSSASGDTIGYTAPNNIPSTDADNGGMLLDITATSATDGTTFATATVVILGTGSTATLSGQYAFFVSGFDIAGNPYAAAGSLTFDGGGLVTAGEEDYNNGNGLTSLADTVTGTYSVGGDGQGTVALTVSDVNVGVAGVQTLALTIVNPNHARIIQFDGSATSSGSLDFQTFTAGDLSQISGAYSYAFSGVDAGTSWSIGGDFVSDGAGNLTTLDFDQDIGGTVNSNTVTGTYSAPDANGRVEVDFGGLSSIFYIVHSEALRVVVADSEFATAGSAFGQGGGAGTFDASALNGPFVFSDIGEGTLGPFAAAGLLTTDGAGNLTAGFGDVNEAGSVTNGAITGTYTVASNGRGTLTLGGGNIQDVANLMVYVTDPALNLADPNNADGGGGALLVDLDTEVFAIGALAPQDTTATFAGNYALGFQSAFVGADLVGQVFSDGVSNIVGSGSLNDLFGTGQTTQSVTGTFTPDATNPGRATSTLVFGSVSGTLNIAAYAATSSEIVYVDIDSGFIAAGEVEGQP